MKYKKIIWYFLIALIACVVVRTEQVFFIIDGTTGFFKKNYSDYNFWIMVFLCGAVIATAIIGALSRREPKKMPKVNWMLGTASVLLSACLIFDSINTTYVSRIPSWQVLALQFFGIASAAFFAAYGGKMLFKYKIPSSFYIIPVLYYVAKLICVFTTVSALTLISDNIFMLASHCAMLVFTLEFAKAANNIDKDNIHKKLLPSGLCTVLLSAFSVLPRLFAYFTGHSNLLHESVSSSISTLIAGLFAAAFVFSYFSNKNLSHHHKHHKHSHHTKQLPIGESGNNQFFINN